MRLFYGNVRFLQHFKKMTNAPLRRDQNTKKMLIFFKKMDKSNCLATRKTAGTHKPRSTEESPRNYSQMHFFQTRTLILSIKNHESFMWTRLTHHENKRKYCGPFSNFIGFSMSYRQNFPLLLVR